MQTYYKNCHKCICFQQRIFLWFYPITSVGALYNPILWVNVGTLASWILKHGLTCLYIPYLLGVGSPLQYCFIFTASWTNTKSSIYSKEVVDLYSEKPNSHIRQK